MKNPNQIKKIVNDLLAIYQKDLPGKTIQLLNGLETKLTSYNEEGSFTPSDVVPYLVNVPTKKDMQEKKLFIPV